MEYALPAGICVLLIGGLIGVKVSLAKRPTFKNCDENYTNIKVCEERHKNIEEKLECIPEIKEKVTKICTILEERDRKL